MLDEHLGYVADARRLALFRAALAKAVVPGMSVADLGCGSGILGYLALEAGAGHVYCVDETDMIDVARQALLREADPSRLTFIRGRSTRLTLPPVDIVICDHVGYFGFDYGIVSFLDDARKRFLKSGGTLIPSRIRLLVAAVGSPRCDELANGWIGDNIPGVFHWLRAHAVNTKHAIHFRADEVFGPPSMLGEIHLHADNPDYFSWSADLYPDRNGVVHGLGGWFECELADGVWMTNSPLSDDAIRRFQVFLPIEEAMPVVAGEHIAVTVMARPTDHLIAWNVEFSASGKRFSYSTWQGELMSARRLASANPVRVPFTNAEGRATQAILGYCDGVRTAAEIEAAVLRSHPDLFPSREEVARFVGKTLGRYADQ